MLRAEKVLGEGGAAGKQVEAPFFPNRNIKQGTLCRSIMSSSCY